MLPPVFFPVSRCFGLPPPDLCGWRYLARVLVEGLRRRRPPAMALIALTHLQASSGEWVGLDSGPGGHSRLVSGCPARFMPYDPFIVLGTLGVRGARLSSAPPQPSPCPRTTILVPIPS